MVANTFRYAITVRRRDERFLFFDIQRNLKGDIYFNYPRLFGSQKKWKPHSSVHADGTVHHKDFNRKFGSYKISPPNPSFLGTETICGLVVNVEQWHHIKKPFQPKPYAGVFEIDVEKFSTDTRWTQLQMNIVEANVQPSLNPGLVLQQAFFADCVPWIALTLIDQTSC